MPWRNTPAKRRQDSARYGAAWRRAREACLRRARWQCEIRIEGICAGTASEVDHIDGAGNDPQHRRLRAACPPCHAQVTARQGGGYRNPRDPDPRPRTAW